VTAQRRVYYRDNWYLDGYAPRSEEKRPEADEESVSCGKVWWCPSPRTRDNQQLLREEKILGNDRFCATGAWGFRDSGQQVHR